MNGATLLQAARGPVLLITLGVLFLLHQNTEHNFNRTFPVLLIVFGLMKLMEFFATKNLEPAPGPALHAPAIAAAADGAVLATNQLRAALRSWHLHAAQTARSGCGKQAC